MAADAGGNAAVHGPPPHRSWRFSRLVVWLSIAVFAALVWRQSFICDDAFIAFRYSKHLAAGEGLRYNLGSQPAVEGFTQLGWVLIIGVVEWLKADPVIWSRVISSSCALMLLLLVLRQARRQFGSSTLAVAMSALFFATWPPFLVWSTGGLGTMPFALAVFATYYLFLGKAGQPQVLAGSCCAVAAMTLRADGLYWVGSMAGLLFLQGLANSDARRKLLRAAFLAALTCAVFLGLSTLWRWITFGDWVPNTARVKVAISSMSLQRGLDYLATHFLSVPASFVVFALGTWYAVRSKQPALLSISFLVAITFLYGILVGGDFMTTARFFVPAGAFLALMAGEVTARVLGHDKARPVDTPDHASPADAVGAAPVCAALLLVGLNLPAAFNLHIAPLGWRKKFHHHWRQPYQSEYDTWVGMRTRAKSWARLGRALGLHTRAGESLVRSTIGGVGYYSDLIIYDQYGLVNRDVAASAPEILRLGTPGHDYKAPVELFDKYNPTYSYAYLHPKNSKAAQGGQQPYKQVIPLLKSDGFPPGLVLVLYRRFDASGRPTAIRKQRGSRHAPGD